MIYNWRGFASVEYVSIGTPKVESSKFDQSVCLLYHKEAVYNFIGRMDSSKSKNKLLSHFHVKFSHDTTDSDMT